MTLQLDPEDLDLKTFALLAEFDDEDREVLTSLLEPKAVAKGRKLYREGSEASELVLLAQGQLELASRRSERKFVVGPGATLGAVSLMQVGPREIVATTLEPCELWLLPREAFRRLVEDHPRTACRLCEAIIAELAGDLREALDDIADR